MKRAIFCLAVVAGVSLGLVGCIPQVVKQGVGAMRDTVDKTAAESTEPVVKARAERIMPVAAQTEAYIGSPEVRIDVESDAQAAQLTQNISDAKKVKDFVVTKTEAGIALIPVLGGIYFALKEFFKRKSAQDLAMKTGKTMVSVITGGSVFIKKLQSVFDKDPSTKFSIPEIITLFKTEMKEAQNVVTGAREMVKGVLDNTPKG
jgi:hypothetical protein